MIVARTRVVGPGHKPRVAIYLNPTEREQLAAGKTIAVAAESLEAVGIRGLVLTIAPSAGDESMAAELAARHGVQVKDPTVPA